MMYIVKTEAFDDNGIGYESQFGCDQDLEKIFDFLLNPKQNIAYSRIEIINYDK